MRLEKKTDKYTSINKKNWNERAGAHFQSKDYRVKEFLSGKSTLLPLELQELGNVKGKKLLHLQCHFGLDTLSWARKGAIVTGVDFSDKAIKLANELKKKTNLSSTFICSDIPELPGKLKGKFDIVFASYGVLCWISDLAKWIEIAGSYLKRGGILYIIDGHPFRTALDYDHKRMGDIFWVECDYFHKKTPNKYVFEYSYVKIDKKLKNKVNYEWQHSMSDIINPIIKNKLKIEFIHEFPFGFFNWGRMKKMRNAYWKSLHKKSIPMILSIKARKY